MLRKGKKTSGFYLQQESIFKIIIRHLKYPNKLNVFLINILQLLPVWIMLLIHIVSKYQFPFREIVSNLIVYVVVTCGTNLYDLFRKSIDTINNIPKIISTFLSIIILCFASILYCLLLLCNVTDIKIEEYIIFLIALILVPTILFISIWQTSII